MRDLGPHKVTARVFLDPQNPRVTGKASSQHLQMDLNALLEFGRFWVIPDYTYEHFANVDSGGIPEKIHRGLLEGVVLLGEGGRCLLTGRYELAHSPKSNILPEADVSLGTLDLAYYVNPNAKIVLDWSRTWDNQRGDRTDEAQLQIHVGY